MSKSLEVFESLERAFAKLKESMLFEDTEPFRDSQIKRFELTFELCWKLMGALLADKGAHSFATRTIIRDAASAKLIKNPETWLEFADARNTASHVYNDEMAREVLEIALGDFPVQVQIFIDEARNHLPAA